MTDTPSSPTDPADDDLLASLYLDGEATADERAQVEADPALLARVRSFEAIATDLTNVAPPPDLARMQIGAALDLFDQQHVTAPATAAPPETAALATVSSVTSLSDRRERKQSRGIPNWLSAAAALALVVGGLGFASTLGGDDTAESATADVAMDSGDDASESGANRVLEESATTMADSGAASAEAFEADEAMEDEAMDDDEAMQDDAMQDDAMEDDAADEAMDEAMADSDEDAMEEADDAAGDTVDVSPGPVPLDGLDATTAEAFLELLSDQPLRPIDDSPCAASPLVDGLFGVDSFIEVVFNGEISSLLVQAGVPSTAVIVGPTCQVELQ